VFQRQLVVVFTGRPRELIKRIVHPVAGIIPTLKAQATIKDVTEWLDRQPHGGPKRIGYVPPEPEKRMTREEAEAAHAMWLKTRPVLEAATEKMRVEGKIVGKRAPAPTQIDNPLIRAEAMKNLQAMNKGGPLPSKEQTK
jgi:hypothetical protein